MKTTNATVYHCDYCGHKLFRRHAMERHEQWCSKNPAVTPACFSGSGCVHLIKKEVTFPSSFGANERRSYCFHCKALDKDMYTIAAERRGLVGTFALDDEQEPMPKSCESFKEITFNDWL